jgi:hypothetical protein
MPMKSLVLALAVAAASLPAQAQNSPAVEALAGCLTDNTSGRDRKDLAKWIFMAIGSHPEIASYVSATAEDKEKLHRTAGELFTRLMAEDCAKELRDASEGDGIRLGFEHLGKIAMQELMTNPEVSQTMSAFGKYLDEDRIKKAAAPEPAAD